MDGPPKYPSTPHWPWSQTVHRDDSYHHDPDFFVRREVVVTEKLDGGNTALWNGEVYARSTLQPSHAGWMAMVRKHHAWKTVGQVDDVDYGEDLYGIHSIEYAPMREDQTYRLFASRSLIRPDWFRDWASVQRRADELGVPTVPVRYTGQFQSVTEITEWFETNIRLPSALGGPCEGFVIRDAGGFPASEFASRVSKYVRANHVQTDQHWTRNWQPCKIIREDRSHRHGEPSPGRERPV